MGGIRVKSLAPLRRNAEIPLRLHIPERTLPIVCSGIVVWSKPNGAAGVRFIKLDEEQKAILTSWLSELEHAASEKSYPSDEFTRITTQVKGMKLNNADALSLIVRRAMQVANASGVIIALGKPENMICLGRAGDAPELGTVIRPGLGLVGECIRGRKLVLCHDATTDPRAVERKQGSALVLPLLVNTELRGVMQVFSAQAHAFDAPCVGTIEKLSDAVVFVTHNAMPQRRLATVTPLPKPVVNSAPVITKPSDSGKLKAFAVTSKLADSAAKPAAAEPELVVSAAEIVVAPVATPSPIAVAPAKPAFETPRSEHVETTTPRRYVPPVPMSAYHPKPQSSGKWMIVIPAAVLIIALPIGGYLLGHRHTPAVVARVPAIAPSQPSTTSSTAPALVAPPVAQSAPAPQVSTAASAPTAKHVQAEPAAREKKAAPAEKPEPEPEPIVLAATAPVERPQHIDVSDSSAPSAEHLPVASTAMPGINLPTNNALPKLIAPAAKVLTGGTLLQRASPIYPQAALTEAVEGQVVLQAVIITNGTVDKIRTISGHPLLVPAAINAVKRWRYDPFKVNGQPVDKELTIVINFRLPR